MRGTIHCCVTLGLLLSMAWAAPQGHKGQGKGHEHDHHQHGKDEAHPHHEGEDSKCHKLMEPNADFAFALYKKLNALPDSQSKNVFFSPVSVSMALSLLALGARDETLSQLYATLGYTSLTPAEINEGYEHMIHMLGHGRGQLQLDVGSALAIREGFQILDKFLEDAKHYFESEAFTVDFSKPEVAAEEINKYIARKTHNKITDMVSGLDPDTLMMLVSYVHFRGKWEKHFDDKLTHKADFHVDENTKVTVDMMQRMGRYDLYEDQDNFTTVLMLPYRGNASMMIVLPDEGKMSEVEASICKHHLQHWHNSLFRRSVDVFLPKFSISAHYPLKDVLTEMGIVNAFSDAADFSGISDKAKVKVSKVSHKAVLSVDERGTEAAAATTIELMPMSMPSIIRLDRPFLVFILEDSTKSILFMGKITNPTA
ncbi:hypothetical protein ACEWY4_021611 [Coilia grayii]|uniref:Serpin domain-containing protein n=1 Tax=Coilia grayii TaxID=363190 RepID=A0ABD1J3N5_9TELE